jgi:prepilin-type N-terminal cleavage/methylation domain-containing protein
MNRHIRNIKRSGKPAFTLIELLIVVAIIAILAAIAVPNFLEAQTRSKVSRVQADFRTVATAIESYFVDANTYPYDQDDQASSGTEDGFRLLTTPISYFSSGRSLNDPFVKPRPGDPNDYAPHYQMASGVDPKRRMTTSGQPVVQAWMLFSWGPDDSPGEPWNGTDYPNSMINDDWPLLRLTGPTDVKALYDPTNGTLSWGNVHRFGGDYNGGNWTIQGIDHTLWGVKVSYP